MSRVMAMAITPSANVSSRAVSLPSVWSSGPIGRPPELSLPPGPHSIRFEAEPPGSGEPHRVTSTGRRQALPWSGAPVSLDWALSSRRLPASFVSDGCCRYPVVHGDVAEGDDPPELVGLVVGHGL